MPTSLADQIPLLPSVRQICSAVADELAQRRVALVLLPPTASADGSREALLGEFLLRRMDWWRVRLPEMDDRHGPVVALSDALGIARTPSGSPRTAEELALAEGMPDVILVEGLAQLPSAKQAQWIAFIGSWSNARRARSIGSVSRPALCIITGSVLAVDVPKPSPQISVHWWVGIPSALEMRLLCRSSRTAADGNHIAMWREYVLPSLAGNDVALAEAFWDSMHLPLDGILSELRAYAQEQGWTIGDLERWGLGTPLAAPWSDRRLSLSAPARRLWAHGALMVTAEYGEEVHPAALALLGAEQEVSHRLWRGQVSLLLPLIDGLRLEICSRLTRQYGEGWPDWGVPMDDEEDVGEGGGPLDCQLGRLCALLGDCPRLEQQRPWRHAVSIARRLRNSLAHYLPVRFADYRALAHEVDRLGLWRISPT